MGIDIRIFVSDLVTESDDCGDLPIVACSYNPCAQLYCKDNGNATCRENFCGGCNAEFYLQDQKIQCGEYIHRQSSADVLQNRCF